MRDAFGGAFMIRVFFVFIIIYVGFTAVALNYAKAFKVKNKVIDYIESNEITNIGSMNAYEQAEMEKYFDEEIYGSLSYRVSTPCNTHTDAKYCNNDYGIVIEEAGKSSNINGTYYKVTAYVGWNMPFLNKILALNGSDRGAPTITGKWKISGETRLIVKKG